MSGWSQPANRGLGQAELIASMNAQTLATASAQGASQFGASALLGAAGGPIGLAVTGAIIATQLLIKKWRQGVARRAASTSIVNQAEPYLQQNLAAYQSSSHTQADQAEAINNFSLVWSEVVSQCQAVGGNAGRACIEDRDESGSAPWGANWFQLYLDPIRNDPDVVSSGAVYDPQTGQYVDSGLLGGIPAWAIALAIGAVGLFAFGGSK